MLRLWGVPELVPNGAEAIESHGGLDGEKGSEEARCAGNMEKIFQIRILKVINGLKCIQLGFYFSEFDREPMELLEDGLCGGIRTFW